MLPVAFNSAAPKFVLGVVIGVVVAVAPTEAVVCAHRLPPVAKGEGLDRGAAAPTVGLGAGVNLGLTDRPMDAKMSSSCLGSGFLGGGFGIFLPRLVTLCSGIDESAGALIGGGVDTAAAGDGDGVRVEKALEEDAGVVFAAPPPATDKPIPEGAEVGAEGSRAAERGIFGAACSGDIPSVVPCILRGAALGDRFGTI
jgi:hypothetical protein